MEKQKYVIYVRVSTNEQGDSGLGLTAQEDACREYVEGVGGDVVNVFKDVESGKSKTRQGIKDAITSCVANKATLVVKNWSRLSRAGLGIQVELSDKKIPVIAQESPNDDPLVRDIRLSIAREELASISRNTKNALAVIKKTIERDGVYNKVMPDGSVKKIYGLGGGNNFTKEVRKKSAEKKIENARILHKPIYKMIVVDVKEGFNFTKIARRLNEAGHTTPSGGKFYRTTVERIYKQFQEKSLTS